MWLPGLGRLTGSAALLLPEKPATRGAEASRVLPSERVTEPVGAVLLAVETLFVTVAV